MNARICISLITALLALAFTAHGNSVGVLWNSQCPHSFAETLEEGESLKKEIPDFHRDLRLPLGWQVGKTCTDPNEQLSKEILFTKKILSEVFKPQIIPLESIDDKFLLLSNLSFKDGKKRETLVVRFKKDKYIIKIMKTIDKKKGKMFITVRLTSKEAIKIKELSGDIFTERILPAKWEKPFYYGRLKRESKILSAGMWMAKDTVRIDSSGKIIRADSHSPVSRGPIGVGLYSRIDFYTNGKFASFKILGGPKMSSRALTDSEKKDGE